ncbi:DUF6653 family protein [Pseudovibrio exalbescens]|nr:DUF6653 family protein [Pseudovibrio exalbescens]
MRAPKQPHYKNKHRMPVGQIKLPGMTERSWERQTSSWSLWSRALTLPLIIIAIWLHTTIGWAWAGLLCLAGFIWLWTNPRLFNPPKRPNSWYARAAFGERIWLNQRAVPIPRQINMRAIALSFVSGLGLLCAVVGALGNNLPMTVIGVVAFYAAKFTFLQLMIRLHAEMRNAHPVYKSWDRTPDNDNLVKSTRHKKVLSQN